jgi:NADPH:quinone reductase-like Zn-dependent oxidoreductase
MRQALAAKVGSFDNLKIVEAPEPRPGPGEVLVRMRAASLNYRDLITIVGGYGSQQRHENLVPLSDGAGEIVELGSGVTRWKAGDRVVGCFFPEWQSGPATEARVSRALGGSADGVACEYRAFAEHAILEIPTYLSFVEAACLPCAGLTAWVAACADTLGPGQTVLTQGTGGVSLFALQFARIAGADVIATSSSAEKLARLRALGANHVINYRDDQNWGQTARGFVPAGVDLVVDIGGGETLSQSLRAVRMGGSISVIGVVAGAKYQLNVMILIMKNVRLQGASVGNRDQFAAMLAAMTKHQVHPVIDRVFPLDELRAALDHLKAGRHIGKVCIEI